MDHRRGLYALLCLGVFICLGTACNYTKHLGKNQYLYMGSKTVVQSSVPIKKSQKNALSSDMDALIRPKPNASILGFRYKLWIYNLAGTPKKNKGLRHWLKYKVGEPPVLASAAAAEKNREILQNRLENKGYFYDTVILTQHTKGQELTDTYTAQIGQPFTYRSITYPSPEDSLTANINRLAAHSFLKKGAQYDLDMVMAERSRIDDHLKEKGFYYFNPNFLELIADTSAGNHQIDATLHLIPTTAPKARNIYHLNEVVVFADYDINTDTGADAPFTYYDGYKILDSLHQFRPVIFQRTLVFKPGDVYNRNDHNLSLNRLVTLGVYKFVKARFVETDTAGPNKLNAFYYLTPTERKSIQFQATGLTRSDNSTGGQVSVSWKNRNLFRGAELLTATVSAGLDEQFIGVGQEIATRTAGVDLDLLVPRFIAPISVHTAGAYVPRTKIDLSYNIFNRSGEYDLTSSKASFGYIFKESEIKEHRLTVFSINLVNPTNINPIFQDSLDRNITLARSIERQFIIGPNYNFNLNTQARPNHHVSNFYFNANIDISANLLGLITGADIAKGKEVTFIGTPFSQYDRFELDFRHYLRLSPTGQFTWVNRITGGVGIAWGNSSTMPFSKEFFAGGTNDIRAFRSDLLGPGSYYAAPQPGTLLVEQPGDIKLEANSELRFPLFSIVKGALFVDAGNVWTRQADTSRPGSVFTGQFLSQVAVGAGVGLRFDVKILVLRVDLATPIREPWLPVSDRWVFSNLANISSTVLNLAIGYPF
jgi:outer membrane protein insertion porin family